MAFGEPQICSVITENVGNDGSYPTLKCQRSNLGFCDYEYLLNEIIILFKYFQMKNGDVNVGLLHFSAK